MKKLQISVLASASVLALTTAAYVPGFTALDVSAASDCPVPVQDGNTISEDVLGAFSDHYIDSNNGVELTGTCTYKVGTLVNKFLRVAEGANITLDLTGATITVDAGIPIQVAEGGTLTIKGTPTTLGTDKDAIVTSAGTLTLDDTTISTKPVLVTGGTATIKDSKLTNNLAVTNNGTSVTISDSEIAGNLTVEDRSKVEISNTTVSGTITAANNAGVTVSSGTFDSAFSAAGSIKATGGKYLKSAFGDISAVEALRTSSTEYSVYAPENDDYYYLEPIIKAENIVFEDFTITEDVETEFVGATLEGSQTKFKYTFDNEDTGKIGTSDNKILANESGVFTITATSTFDPTVKKTAQVTVNSQAFQLGLTYKSDTTNDRFNDESTFADGTEVVLYTSDQAEDKETLTLTLGITDKEEAASTTAVTYSVVPADEEAGIVSITNTGNDYKITADKAGDINVIAKATSLDGENVSSATLKVKVYDKIQASDFVATDITVSKGDTINPLDQAITLAEDTGRRINTESLTYAYSNSQIDVNESTTGGPTTIYIKGTNDLGTGLNLNTTITDGSGAVAKLVAGTNNCPHLLVISDFAVSDESSTALDFTDNVATLSLTEGGEAITLTAGDIAPAAIQEKATPVYTFRLVEEATAIDDQGNETTVYNEIESSDYLTLTQGEAEDGSVATIAGKLATGENKAYVQVLVNGTTSVSKLIDVSVVADFTDITVTNSDGKEVANGAVITQAQGEIAKYAINTISESAEVTSIFVDSSNPEVKYSRDGRTFTITGNTEGETATITVLVKGKNKDGLEKEFQKSFDVTISGETAKPTPEHTEKNGIYIIRSVASDKVVDITSASTASGANAQLYSDNGTIAQKFILRDNGEGYYTIENLKSQMALTVNGTNVEQQAIAKSGATDAQLWQIVDNGNGSSLISKSTGLYLDVQYGHTTNGTNIQVYQGNQTTAQSFALDLVDNFEADLNVPDGTFNFETALKAGQHLNVAGNSTKNSANVWIYHEDGTTADQFNLVDNGNGYFTIVTKPGASFLADGTLDGTSKVLDVLGGGTANGTNVQQYEYNGTIAQQWRVIENEDGTYSLASRCNGLFLDIQYGHSDDYTNAWLYEGNGSTAQKFNILPLTSADDDEEENTPSDEESSSKSNSGSDSEVDDEF